MKLEAVTSVILDILVEICEEHCLLLSLDPFLRISVSLDIILIDLGANSTNFQILVVEYDGRYFGPSDSLTGEPGNYVSMII